MFTQCYPQEEWIKGGKWVLENEAKYWIGGENDHYYGSYTPEAFITAQTLIQKTHFIPGILLNEPFVWHYFQLEGVGKLLIPSKPLKFSISWKQLEVHRLIDGKFTIDLHDKSIPPELRGTYKVRLLKGVNINHFNLIHQEGLKVITDDLYFTQGSEWNRTLMRLHYSKPTTQREENFFLPQSLFPKSKDEENENGEEPNNEDLDESNESENGNNDSNEEENGLDPNETHPDTSNDHETDQEDNEESEENDNEEEIEDEEEEILPIQLSDEDLYLLPDLVGNRTICQEIFYKDRNYYTISRGSKGIRKIGFHFGEHANDANGWRPVLERIKTVL